MSASYVILLKWQERKVYAKYEFHFLRNWNVNRLYYFLSAGGSECNPFLLCNVDQRLYEASIKRDSKCDTTGARSLIIEVSYIHHIGIEIFEVQLPINHNIEFFFYYYFMHSTDG